MKYVIRCILVCLLFGGISLFSATGDVQGFNVAAEISVNVARGETVLSYQTQGTTLNHQMVLVLQHAPTSGLPFDWTGNARLYLSEGVVAIVGQDGKKWMFKFPDQPTPESLKDFGFTVFEVFGIARYGEGKPISSKELSNLKTHGRCSLARQQQVSPSLVSPLSVAEGCNGVACTSGGEGATSCSTGGGGCSVSCSAGYYACCSVNGNNCSCCKVN